MSTHDLNNIVFYVFAGAAVILFVIGFYFRLRTPPGTNHDPIAGIGEGLRRTSEGKPAKRELTEAEAEQADAAIEKMREWDSMGRVFFKFGLIFAAFGILYPVILSPLMALFWR